MLADKLKIATETSHQQLEKQLVLQMKSIRSTEEYVGLLQLFYSYFGGLEELIHPYITPAQLPDYANRRKTEALATDIVALQGAIPLKAGTADLPQLNNYLQAFGALYVIEGSTLGGKIISKMMAKQLNLHGDTGLTFFNGYGDAAESMWNTFKNAMNTQARTAEEEAQVIAAANHTFDMFKQWIEKVKAQKTSSEAIA